jgi:hypothetical protein
MAASPFLCLLRLSEFPEISIVGNPVNSGLPRSDEDRPTTGQEGPQSIMQKLAGGKPGRSWYIRTGDMRNPACELPRTILVGD